MATLQQANLALLLLAVKGFSTHNITKQHREAGIVDNTKKGLIENHIKSLGVIEVNKLIDILQAIPNPLTSTGRQAKGKPTRGKKERGSGRRA